MKENQNSANWRQFLHSKPLSFSGVGDIASVQQSLESAEYEEEPLVSHLPMSKLPPVSEGNSSGHYASPQIGLLPFPDCQENLVTCVIEPAGNLALRLRAGVVLDIYPSMVLRLHNTRQDSTLALSPCASQLALVHPVGRLLQYATRIEVQVEDMASVKNAKIHPKGVSFTANNMALVYLLDEAGARSCADMFHDLYATHIANTLFAASKEVEEVKTFQGQTRMGAQLLEQVQYWRDSIDHWVLGDVEVAQTKDGLVTVQRRLAGDTITLKTSPNNGKVRYDSRHLQVTTSLGDEAHLFRNCDLDTVVNFLAKQNISRLMETSPKAVKEGLMSQCATILACYRKNCASPSSAGQLILPECMKLLPLYTNCLIKSDALSGGSDLGCDDRAYH